MTIDSLAMVARGPTAITQVGQTISELTGFGLARSSPWERFSPGFSRRMSWALQQRVEDARERTYKPPGALAVFTDVLARRLHGDEEPGVATPHLERDVTQFCTYSVERSCLWSRVHRCEGHVQGQRQCARGQSRFAALKSDQIVSCGS
jgi:hypothetical protein